MQRRLEAFTADAAKVGRSSRRSQHVRALRRHTRWGKPVAIAEFGTCTYRGAAQRGGMAWDALDETGERVRGGLVRSERAQARHLVEMLRIFEAVGLDSALVYQFVTPDAPHRARRRHDLDLASYGIVKPIWKTPDQPKPGWHWEPKAAFHALAHEFGQTA
jgi:hypothetical protein